MNEVLEAVIDGYCQGRITTKQGTQILRAIMRIESLIDLSLGVLLGVVITIYVGR